MVDVRRDAGAFATLGLERPLWPFIESKSAQSGGIGRLDGSCEAYSGRSGWWDRWFWKPTTREDPLAGSGPLACRSDTTSRRDLRWAVRVSNGRIEERAAPGPSYARDATWWPQKSDPLDV